MNYANHSKKNISFLVITLLILIIVSAGFGAVSSFADIGRYEQKQRNRPRFLKLRRSEIANKRRSGQAEFSSKSSLFTYFKPEKPFLEVLLAGDLDATFGAGGKVTTQIGSSKSEALAVALQADGKFVAAGYTYNGANTDFALVRYNSDGSLDATFGSGGKVATDVGNADNQALALAIQPDGKLIAAGNSFNGVDDDFTLVRYNSDGTLDSSFGTSGITTTNFNNSSEVIEGIAVQADGKIVAAGYTLSGSFFRFALARYNTNGTLDETFGMGGKLTTAFSAFDDLARAIAIQTDGKIVVVGESNADFAAARYNSDGSLDTTFDGDGKVITSINVFDSAYGVAIQTDGKIVAAGETGDGNNSDFALIRYNIDGSLDTTFDGDGTVTTPIGNSDEFASSVAVQTNGKIIAGGFSFNGNNDDFAVVRYNANGSLDTTFGTGGKVTSDFGNSYDYASALAIQSANKLVAVGSANSNFAAAVYSLSADGCTYTLSPTSLFISGAGGPGGFNVTTGANCTYTAVTSSSWIIFTNNPSGSGNGTINFLVGSNGTTARTGTITVGDSVFIVNQTAGSVKSRKRIKF